MEHTDSSSSMPIISNENSEPLSDHALESEFLNDIDSYWDDLSARLTVSRMVSDSTIKGIVSAVQEEANEKISSKELEVALLNEKLNHYRSIFDLNFDSHRCSSEIRENLEHVKQLERLKIRVGDQLSSVQLNNSVSEQEWKEGVQKEIYSIIIHEFVTSIQDEFEMNISQQQNVPAIISNNLKLKIDEISSIREDLEILYSSLPNSGSGLSISDKSYETGKEWNSVKRIFTEKYISKTAGRDILIENFDSVGNIDFLWLQSKTKDEIIMYFKSERNSMRRKYQLAIDELTEEVFTLRRILMNEIGPSPFHFFKEKDFETIKKKISELIQKLDILKENKETGCILNDGDPTNTMKENIDTLLKNHCLQNLMVDKKRDANYEEFERLQLYIEELEIEATLKEEKYKSYLNSLIDAAEHENEAVETITTMVANNYMILFKGVIEDAISIVNPIVMNLINEKNLLYASYIESKDVICLEIAENEMQKQEILSLGCQLEQQKEEFNSVCNELRLFKNQSTDQESVIIKAKSEFNTLKSEMEGAHQLLKKQELELEKLKQKLMIATYDLKELEGENHILDSNNHAKEEKILAFMTKDKEQKEHLNTILTSTLELSKAIDDLECKSTQKLEENESRLSVLSEGCVQLKHFSDVLMRKVASWKISYEAKCEDLQKAETEVDMLGDEVETLFGLLQRIYIALDHYSPVLRHYPGVMETLKLIKREIKDENTGSF